MQILLNFKVLLQLKNRTYGRKTVCGFSIILILIGVMTIFFFFCLGFLSRTFTIHGTAGEGEGIYLGIGRAIATGGSSLGIVGSRTRAGNL